MNERAKRIKKQLAEHEYLATTKDVIDLLLYIERLEKEKELMDRNRRKVHGSLNGYK